jgi:hypothetical protein
MAGMVTVTPDPVAEAAPVEAPAWVETVAVANSGLAWALPVARPD